MTARSASSTRPRRRCWAGAWTSSPGGRRRRPSAPTAARRSRTAPRPTACDEIRRRDGSTLPGRVHHHPDHGQRRALGSVMTFRDITARKEMESAHAGEPGRRRGAGGRRPADRPRQPPHLPRAAAHRGRAGAPPPSRPGPGGDGPRSLQAGQRRPRAPDGRPRAGARGAACCGTRPAPASWWRAWAARSSRCCCRTPGGEEAFRAAERIRRAIAAARFPGGRLDDDVRRGRRHHPGAGRRIALPPGRRRPLPGQAPRPRHGAALLAGDLGDAAGPRRGRAPGAPAGPGEHPPAGPVGRLARTGIAAPLRADGRTSAPRSRRLSGGPPSARPCCARPGCVHDVGKIGVSEAILLKSGPLTPEETSWCASTRSSARAS